VLGLVVAMIVAPDLVTQLARGTGVLTMALLGFMVLFGAREDRIAEVSGTLVALVFIAEVTPWVRPALLAVLQDPVVPMVVVAVTALVFAIGIPMLAAGVVEEFLKASSDNPAPPRQVTARRARVVEGAERPRTDAASRERDPGDDDLGVLP